MYLLKERNYINVYTIENKGKDIKKLGIKNVLVCMCDTYMCACACV